MVGARSCYHLAHRAAAQESKYQRAKGKAAGQNANRSCRRGKLETRGARLGDLALGIGYLVLGIQCWVFGVGNWGLIRLAHSTLLRAKG